MLLTCLLNIITSLQIAIEGKSLCGSLGNNLKGMTRMLHAWSVENGLCLGQQAVKDKSNEINAMIPLLKILDLKGFILTVDAIHSHPGANLDPYQVISRDIV